MSTVCRLERFRSLCEYRDEFDRYDDNKRTTPTCSSPAVIGRNILPPNYNLSIIYQMIEN